MSTKPLSEYAPGPYRAEGGAIKAVSHGHWYTVALVDKARFTPEGRAGAADSIARVCNSHDDLLAALRPLVAIVNGARVHKDKRIGYLDAARTAIAKATGHE